MRQQLQGIAQAAPYGGKASPWLQARAAVLATVSQAVSCEQLARAAWLVENLVYDDLLKATEWAQQRLQFRRALQEARTVAQVGVAQRWALWWLLSNQMVWELGVASRRAGNSGSSSVFDADTALIHSS